MTLHPLHDVPLSHAARCLFVSLRRSGGSMRVGPLLRGLGRVGVSEHAFVEAIFELAERYWITIVWRKDATRDDAEPLRDMTRLTTTRFGRSKSRSSWPGLTPECKRRWRRGDRSGGARRV